MKLYAVKGYGYEEEYIIYISENKEKALEVGKDLFKKRPRSRIWFRVVEVELDKLYYPGTEDFDQTTKQLWDEHDDWTEQDREKQWEV